MSGYVHGSTDAREIERLDRQAAFVAPWSLVGFAPAEGARILDLGCGTGAMAAEIARRFPGRAIVGLDASKAQLAVARARHPIAEYVEGDARAIPFADGSFDHVHVSWLFEHVADLAKVVREIRRVLRPSGTVQQIEVDNETLSISPPAPRVTDLMRALDAAQIAAGGDPTVGRRLEPLYRAEGFAILEATAVELVGDDRDPEFFRAFAEEFAEIFESVDEALGAGARDAIDGAAADLRALPSRPGASMRYRPMRLRAAKRP